MEERGISVVTLCKQCPASTQAPMPRPIQTKKPPKCLASVGRFLSGLATMIQIAGKATLINLHRSKGLARGLVKNKLIEPSGALCNASTTRQHGRYA